MAAIEPVLLSKETIKPSTPTSEDLRTYKLSYLDYISPHVYNRNIFFFANRPFGHRLPTTSDLKQSLSKVLDICYPLAGRIKDKVSLDCNDEGIEFFETQIACKLADVLGQTDIEKMCRFLPLTTDFAPKEFDPKSLAVIQVTHFECGGVAIGTMFSGKLTDAPAIAAIMNEWATITLNSSKTLSAQFVGASVLPLPSSASMMPIPLPERPSFPTRRLIISASKIEALKGSLGSSEPPVNEAIVAAVIFKCIDAAMKGSGLRKKRVMLYGANLREMVTPPLAGNSIGNFFTTSTVLVGEEEMEVPKILEKMKAARAEMVAKFSKKESEDAWSQELYKEFLKFVRMMLTEPLEFFLFSSWCRLPLYDMDFGWGKPVWVGSTCLPWKNCVAIGDSNKEGEIQVFVGLEDELMANFERSEELLAFASMNPSIPLN